MADPLLATITQLKNIQARTGMSIAELHAAVAASGAAKFAEKRSWLMQRFKLGYGDANAVVHFIDKPLPDLGGGAPSATATAPPSTEGDPLDTLYAGTRAGLRPVHEAVMAAVRSFGPLEEAPKKSYVSLRRNKQFAMVGPATKDSIEVGLNLKGVAPHARLKMQPPASMCTATTRLSSAAEVDATLVGWLKQAYDGAG